MTDPVIWPGTPGEWSELLTAISHNCECQFGLMGIRVSTCVPHAEVVKDQRWLDGMMYARQYWAGRSPGAGQRVVRSGV